jgi:hypothetical protein
MRLEIFILGITAFFVYNTYHDGKYTKMLLSFKKYYQMIFFAFLGIGVYWLLKKNPVQGKNMLLHANNMIKYMPIDRSTMDMVSPLFDFTGKGQNQMPFMEEYSNPNHEGSASFAS